MSVYAGPEIITGGLVGYWDAGNTKSYPRSGTTWNDVSGNGNYANIVNTPTFSTNNGGYFSFNGASSQYALTQVSMSSYFSGLSVSHFSWIYPTAAGQLVAELGQTAISTGWHDTNIEIDTNGDIYFSTWHGSLANRVVSNQSFNNWYYVGFSYNGTTLTAYVNGSPVGTTTFTRQKPNNLYYGLFSWESTTMTSVQRFGNGRLSTFSVYNRELTAVEVQQNFNATKGRFGL